MLLPASNTQSNPAAIHKELLNGKKNNAMLDPVETKNNNQSKKEGQESDVEIVMESNNVTSIVVPVDSLPAHE